MPADKPADRIALATQVYPFYARLMQLDPHGLAGKMLLAGSWQANDSEPNPELWIRAANIAGAASLLVLPNPAQARAQLRSGVCDFLVTTLDEALRILKNELRLKHPAAVCLLASPTEVLAACLTRGVQPDLLTLPTKLAAAPSPIPTAHQSFATRGALLLTSTTPATPGGNHPQTILQLASWTAPAQTAARLLPAIDTLALEALNPGHQPERRRWLTRSPQYLGRTAGVVHSVPMEPSEAARLAAALSQAQRDQRLPESIRLHYGVHELNLALQLPQQVP